MVVLAVAVAVGILGMAVAAAQLRPDSKPCLDNISIQPQANTACVAPETPSTIVFGVGAAGASIVVGGFLVYRRTRRADASA